MMLKNAITIEQLLGNNYIPKYPYWDEADVAVYQHNSHQEFNNFLNLIDCFSDKSTIFLLPTMIFYREKVVKSIRRYRASNNISLVNVNNDEKDSLYNTVKPKKPSSTIHIPIIKPFTEVKQINYLCKKYKVSEINIIDPKKEYKL